jgi:hypothetical protein
VKYASDKPPVQIKSNDRTGLTADFAPGAQPGEYTIFYKWDYVPATPLNIACYNKNAMNEVYNNEIVAITYYRKIRRGGYGDSGQWASSIYFVGMKNGKADEGKYTVYIHDNVFKSNDVFVSGDATNMDIRIEKNKFILLSDPAPTDSHAVFFTRGLGQDIQNAVKAGGNEFIGMSP